MFFLKKSLFQIFTLFFILSSCSYIHSVNRDKIIGTYSYSGIYGVGSAIELKKDNTFQYDWQTGLIRGTTYGTWYVEKKKIILKSNLQPSLKECEALIRSENKNLDSLEIKVFDRNNEMIPSATCVLIFDSKIITGSKTNTEGKAILKKVKADSMSIYDVSFKTITCKYDSTKDYYEFRLDEVNYYYKYFENEKWILKKDKLLSPYQRRDKYIKNNP